MYHCSIRREIHIFLAMFLLISCQSTSFEATPSQPVSEIISIEESPTQYETVVPSKTPSPTLTPRTSTPDANSLELPTWVKNPASQIVLFGYHPDLLNRSSEIGFFNVASGEQAIIKLPFGI